MLVGHLSDRTISNAHGWSRELITIDRDIRLGTMRLPRDGDLTALRTLLEQIYARSPVIRDPLSNRDVPRVTVEIRAGGRCPAWCRAGRRTNPHRFDRPQNSPATRQPTAFCPHRIHRPRAGLSREVSPPSGGPTPTTALLRYTKTSHDPAR